MLKKIITDRSRVINDSKSADGRGKFELPYWVEVATQQPSYIYYFGPFDSYIEAEREQSGYIEDLRAEKAMAIAAKIKRCVPDRLTVGAEAELF